MKKQSVTISNQALNLNLNEILQDIENLEIYTKLPKNSGYNQLKDKVNNLIDHINYISNLQSNLNK